MHRDNFVAIITACLSEAGPDQLREAKGLIFWRDRELRSQEVQRYSPGDTIRYRKAGSNEVFSGTVGKLNQLSLTLHHPSETEGYVAEVVPIERVLGLGRRNPCGRRRRQEDSVANTEVFLCRKCGYGSVEHGMEGHPAYQCVAEMAQVPSPAGAVRELVEALEPFAREAETWPSYYVNSDYRPRSEVKPGLAEFTLGDLRHAARVFATYCLGGKAPTKNTLGLLPCPFCKEAEALEVSEPYDGMGWARYAVHCENCGTQGPPHAEKDGAEKLWNDAPRDYLQIANRKGDTDA